MDHLTDSDKAEIETIAEKVSFYGRTLSRLRVPPDAIVPLIIDYQRSLTLTPLTECMSIGETDAEDD